MNLSKFFITVLLAVVFLFPAIKVVAMTDAEKQALIQTLTQQIVLLTQQIAQLQAQQGTTWCYTFNANLGFSNSGTEEVVNLHNALDREGISFSPDGIDVYAKGTSDAISAFQLKYGISPQTGYVGTLTRTKLNSLYKCVLGGSEVMVYGAKPAPVPASATPTAGTCQPGDVTELNIKCLYGLAPYNNGHLEMSNAELKATYTAVGNVRPQEECGCSFADQGGGVWIKYPCPAPKAGCDYSRIPATLPIQNGIQGYCSTMTTVNPIEWSSRIAKGATQDQALADTIKNQKLIAFMNAEQRCIMDMVDEYYVGGDADSPSWMCIGVKYRYNTVTAKWETFNNGIWAVQDDGCNKTCTPNWSYSEWSVCSLDKTQTRTAEDLNKCGPTYDRGPLTRACTPCIPKWRVGGFGAVGEGWGSCSADGIQTRIVEDLNNCTTAITYPDKPATTQTCNPASCTSRWYLGAWGECVNGQQTRLVSDTNRCKVETNKPNTTQSCTLCTPNWQTGAWGACSQYGMQSRTVTDLNNCAPGTSSTEPPDTNQSCTPGATTHLACNAQYQCVSVNGAGTDTCAQNSDCVPAQVHHVCISQKCVTIAGLGQDTCTSDSNCLSTTPSITITSPSDANIQWQAGTTQNITWSSENLGSLPVTIRLSDDRNYTSALIFTGVSASAGTYSWTIPLNLAGTQYKVTVGSGTVSDFSNNYFTITAPTATHLACNAQKQCVQTNGAGTNTCATDTNCLASAPTIIVTNPNGPGVEWQIGTMHTINWSAINFDSPSQTATIRLFDARNNSSALIATNIPVTPSYYSWTIPYELTAGTQYKITVASGNASDYSDNYFSLTPPAPIIGSNSNGNQTAGIAEAINRIVEQIKKMINQ